MIVDSRCFLEVKEGELWPQWIIDYGAAMSGSPPEQVKARMEEHPLDETGDLLVKDMDEAGIDKTILVCPDNALSRGVGDKISLEEYIEIYYQAVKRHPGRLYLVAGIDPRRPDAAKFVENAYKKYGIVGIWLATQQGFSANEHFCYKVYAKCQELGIVCTIYGAPEIQPLSSITSRPILVDQVAADFPNLTLVLNKAISAWWEEAAGVARHKPNVYLDTANSQIMATAKPRWEFYRQLRLLMSLATSRKVMFASAWPIYRWWEPVNHINFIKLIKNPPPECKQLGIEFSEKELNAYLGDNAMRVYKLK